MKKGILGLILTISLILVVFGVLSFEVSAATEKLASPIITGICIGRGGFDAASRNNQDVYVALESTDDNYARQYEVLWGTTNNPTMQAEVINHNGYNGIHIDVELTPETTYYFKVRRCHGSIKSEWSSVYSYKHKILSAPLISDVSLSFSPVYNYNGAVGYYQPVLVVKWGGVVNATQYIVEVQHEYSYGYSQYLYQAETNTSCGMRTWNGLIPGDKLRIYVKATDSYRTYSNASVAYEFIVPDTLISSIYLSTVTGNVTKECKSLTLKQGESKHILSSLSPYNAVNQEVNWTSSDTEVATVSSSGYVTALSDGKTTLTCYAEYGDAYKTCEVIVTPSEETTEPEEPEEITGANVSVQCGDNATWTLDENGLLKITGTGAVWNRNKYSVYSYLNYIKSVEISEGITELGEFTFSNCVNLTEIVLCESLESIKQSAFSGCPITSITIPEKVSYIEGNPFSDCKSLTQINVVRENEKYFSVDGVLFESENLMLVSYPRGKNLKEYSVFAGVEHIGPSAFSSNAYLESIVLPETVKSIGSSAFGYCKSLKNVTMPDSIVDIGTSAFYDSGLTRVEIPSRVEVIPSSAFAQCQKLDYVVIPKSVMYIGYRAFDKKTSIADVDFEGTADEWNDIVFDMDNEAITTAKINYSSTHIHTGGTATCSEKAICSFCGKEYGGYSHSLEFIPYKASTCTESGWDAYEKCLKCGYSTYAESAVLSHTLGKYGAVDSECESVGNITYYKCSSCAKYFSDREGDNEITKEDTIIASLGHNYKNGKCTRCSKVEPNKCGENLTWSIDENGVLTIDGSGEMWGYYSWTPSAIKEVIINNGVSNIGTKAFYGCDNLTKITIPDSVTTIGEKAFVGSSLTEVVIPKSVTSIGEHAFYNCSKLTKITVPFVGGSRTNNTILGYLFDRSTSSYKDPTSGAIIYKTIYHIPSTLKNVIVTDAMSITGQSFKNCSHIETITLSNTLSAIDAEAFADCEKLSDVYYEGTESEWDNIFSGTLSAELHILGSTISSVSLNKTTSRIYEGENETLIVTILPETGTNKNVIWESSDDTIVSVEGGVIKGVSVGTATITVTTINGKSASCVVTVDKKVTSVFLNKTTLTINVGVTDTLFAIVLPSGATNKTVVWSSLDESVATVSNGVVTAISAGTAIITATTVDGGFTASCTVTVTAPFPSYTLGDANSDGEVDFVDALLVLKHDARVSQLSGDNLSAADANFDGEVDFVDALLILKYDAGLISSFK